METGDRRGLFYFAGFCELIFGSSEFAVRWPTVLVGALTVWPVFLLAKALFKNIGPAYLSSLFLAILPWHIVLSRAGHEAIVGYFLITFSLVYLLQYLQERPKLSSRHTDPSGASRTGEGSILRFFVRQSRPQNDSFKVVFSCLLLISSYFFYHGTRILVPLMLAIFTYDDIFAI